MTPKTKEKVLYYVSLPYHYVWRFWRFLREFGIRAHCRKLRGRLRNTTPSIICNNCIGGLLLHDLGLEFRSPTVNLWMEPDDFIRFAGNLRAFLSAEWIELPPELYDEEAHPAARLRCEAGEITLHLQHYESFGEAKAAWERRVGRVDYGNLYLVAEFVKLSREQLAALEALPYERKAFLTAYTAPEFPHTLALAAYRKKKYRGGQILRRPIWGVKRRFEAWDYVAFLNTGEVRMMR